MRYAHIVLGLPLDRSFDYTVPEELESSTAPGCRVSVNFRGKRSIGYVVGISPRTSYPAVKPLLALIDRTPLLPAGLMHLTQKLAKYYCCSWGEMIETALPEKLRGGGRLEPFTVSEDSSASGPGSITVLRYSLTTREERYVSLIRATLQKGKFALVLVPDAARIPRFKTLFAKHFPGVAIGILSRKQPDEARVWQDIRAGKFPLVLGTRSAVFAPLGRPGLIVMDEEPDHGYKQDQVPHYHAREVCLRRSRDEGWDVVFGAAAPSLELFQMYREGKVALETVDEAQTPAVKVIDITRLPFSSFRQKVFVSRYAEEAIAAALVSGTPVLVFLNRKGFATSAACSTCGASLKCPRCSTNLVYHFSEKTLSCRYCGFRSKVPSLCPACSSGYIKFMGAGTEKVESELARMFPSAKLAIIGSEDERPAKADIYVSTQSVLSAEDIRFGLTLVLSLDNSLNHADFRSTEKTYCLLTRLSSITSGSLLIQTTVAGHYCVEAVEKKKPDIFYSRELALRAQLGFPPVRHFALVKCRGVSEEKTKEAATALARALGNDPPKGISCVSVNPGQPERLRGKYYRVILMSGADAEKLSGHIKNCLNDFRRSGIIITVDMDPL